MGNIKNFNFAKLDLKLSNSDYWDFYLANDYNEPSGEGLDNDNGNCKVVWYDFNEPTIYGSNTDSIYSLVSWDMAINTGHSLTTFGLTGIDNGRILFEKGSDPTNPELVNALTGSTLVIPSNDVRLNLHKVSGTTNQFSYDTNIFSDAVVGDYLQLRGGFYQGFYKLDGEAYEVLPTRVEHAWVVEFWLKREGLETPNNILNNARPENKGFFFYMGTRSENKFWNQWHGANTGCTSACTANSGCTENVSTWCTIPKEFDVSLVDEYGNQIPLDPPRTTSELITNEFLIYGRALDRGSVKLTAETNSFIYKEPVSADTKQCTTYERSYDGLGTKTVCSYDGNGIAVIRTTEVLNNKTNPFLVYGRAGKDKISGDTCVRVNDGYGKETVCSFSGFTSPETQVNYNLDIIDNALGFRIKDDGSIGYRLLTVTGECVTNISGEKSYVSGVTIEEKYSEPNMVKEDEWVYVVIRFVTNTKSTCELTKDGPRKGKLMFYVNGNLKFVVNDFSEFIAKRLNEDKNKQIGVPFNFSLGGGSQGLIESQTFDGLDPSDRGLPIEEYFSGTFIGGISQFRFNICDLTLKKMRNQYLSELSRYYPDYTDCILSFS
jgi:hypothetical protein